MKQKIKGGKGDKLNPKDVDKHQLAIGIRIEKEHTSDSQLAKEIALDHLAEDPKYYTKLKTAHLESKSMKLSKLLKEIQIVPPVAPESILKKKIKITSGNGEKETITAPPITKPEVRPIRRPLGNPNVDPKPKAENQGYGWDVKKGLTMVPKPVVKGSNKPKVKKESLINKITQRFKKLTN